MNTLERNVLLGAVAGAIGTAAMTAFMKPALAGYLPPTWRPTQFVPKQIIEWTERQAGNPDALSEDQERGAAVLAHLGYGAAMGALYGLARDRWTGMPALLAGLLWGAGVWTCGYEGWLPMLGVRPATTQQPLRKWPVPIVNHLIYGMVTALTFERLRDEDVSTKL